MTIFTISEFNQLLTFTQPTTFSFNWTFLTNDATRNLSGFNANDYAFVAVNGVISNLASTTAGSGCTLTVSTTSYCSQVSGTAVGNFLPGTYNFALGVVDVGDVALTSALQISNADLTEVPEPDSLLGLLVTLGFLGSGFLRRGQNK